MKHVKNTIWCMVALWFSTGVFSSLIDIWKEGGWWAIIIWFLLVIWAFLFVFILGVALKKQKDITPESK